MILPLHNGCNWDCARLVESVQILSLPARLPARIPAIVYLLKHKTWIAVIIFVLVILCAVSLFHIASFLRIIPSSTSSLLLLLLFLWTAAVWCSTFCLIKNDNIIVAICYRLWMLYFSFFSTTEISIVCLLFVYFFYDFWSCIFDNTILILII